MDPEQYALKPVPSLAEFEELWKLWDIVTLKMIPESELLAQPIKLRNVFLFYLGHIPTFLDIHLARVTDGKLTEPSDYRKIFERGIDPDVDNPEKCHAHSEIPSEWPPAQDVLAYQDKVRQRVRSIYSSGAAQKDLAVGRALWFGLEHEIMHVETLLYMLIQSEKTLPPPNAPKPDFEALAKQAGKTAVPNEWFAVPASTVSLGFDDAHLAQDSSRYFGWDIEVPHRTVETKGFEAKARPITNGEYAEYLKQTSSDKFPASWFHSGGTANGALAIDVSVSLTAIETYLDVFRTNYCARSMVLCLSNMPSIGQ